MLYSIFKKNSTEEYHLYKAFSSAGICRADDKSICEGSEKNNSTLKYKCLTESEARLAAANVGKPFCGTCVSHLYETY